MRNAGCGRQSIDKEQQMLSARRGRAARAPMGLGRRRLAFEFAVASLHGSVQPQDAIGIGVQQRAEVGLIKNGAWFHGARVR